MTAYPTLSTSVGEEPLRENASVSADSYSRAALYFF